MGFFSDINPIKAVDNALVQLDKGVKNYGGWETVGPAAAAIIAAPYLAPELLAAEGLAGSTAATGGFGLNAAGTGATFGSLTAPTAGYTFGGLSASQVPTLAGGLSLGSAGAAGLTAAQKAMLIRSAGNALGQTFGGSGTEGMSSGGGGGAGGYNYANMPFLANPQQNQTFMKTGADVSGSGTTTTGMPVQLDTTRHNILMANLLRG